MGEPLSAAADQVTMAEALAGAAETPVGTLGTVRGVARVGGVEAGPGPAWLVAVTVKPYSVPLIRPVMGVEVSGATTVTGPGAPAPVAVTVKEVIGEPPLSTGADQVTVAEAFSGLATTPVGAPGTVIGVAKA